MDNPDHQNADEHVADKAVEFKEISVGSSFSSFKKFKDSFAHLKKEGFYIKFNSLN